MVGLEQSHPIRLQPMADPRLNDAQAGLQLLHEQLALGPVLLAQARPEVGHDSRQQKPSRTRGGLAWQVLQTESQASGRGDGTRVVQLEVSQPKPLGVHRPTVLIDPPCSQNPLEPIP